MNRNTLPLFNLAWYKKLFWDGRVNSIEEQIFEPVKAHNELNVSWIEVEKRINKSAFYKSKFKQVFEVNKIDSNIISKALAQFLRTLISNHSKFDKVLQGKDYLNKEEQEGFVLMNEQTKGYCLHCHSTDANALATSLEFSNNGLDEIKNTKGFKDKGLGAITKKDVDVGKFKIPSLRNIALTAPYMHDGRFNTLEEVLDFYATGLKHSPTIDSKMEFVHQQGNRLSKEEQKAIIAFLKTMTDSVFISKKEFSNPFIKNKKI
jgi:cytochrome c peroxidase